MKFISSPQIAQQLNATHNFDKAVLDKMPDGAAINYLFKGNADGHFSRCKQSSRNGRFHLIQTALLMLIWIMMASLIYHK